MDQNGIRREPWAEGRARPAVFRHEAELPAAISSVRVYGRPWRPLLQTWLCCAAGFVLLNLLVLRLPQLADSHPLPLALARISLLLLLCLGSLPLRRPQMWLRGAELYYESGWIAALIDLSGELFIATAGSGRGGAPRQLVLQRPAHPPLRIRLDDWPLEELRRLLLALRARPDVRLERRAHQLLVAQPRASGWAPAAWQALALRILNPLASRAAAPASEIRR